MINYDVNINDKRYEPDRGALGGYAMRGKTLCSCGYGPAFLAFAAMAMLTLTAATAAEPRPDCGTPPTQAEFEASIPTSDRPSMAQILGAQYEILFATRS
jgi:hypothetical protein